MFEEGARDEDPTRDSTIAPLHSTISVTGYGSMGGIVFTGGSRDTRLTVTHEPPHRHALYAWVPPSPRVAFARRTRRASPSVSRCRS